MSIYFNWVNFKSITAAKNLGMQYVEDTKRYEIFAFDDDIKYETEIWKDTTVVEGLDVTQNNTDKTDFETNFKTTANQPITPKTVDRLPKVLTAVSPDDVSLYVSGREAEITGTTNYVEASFPVEIQLQGVDVYVKGADWGDNMHFDVGYTDGGGNWVSIKRFGETVYAMDDVGWNQYFYKNNAVSKIPSTLKLRLIYNQANTITIKKVIVNFITHK